MKRLIPLPACLCMLVLLIGISSSSYALNIKILSPNDGVLNQRTGDTADIPVSLTASGLTAGDKVELILDEGTKYQETVQLESTSGLYTYTFSSVPLGEHKLDAYVVAPDNSHVDHTDKANIGVGDLIVAMGDSITAGEVDDIYTDNWSADGRNGPRIDPYTGVKYGGFEPILNNLLTTFENYPHSVINRGLPGETAHDAISRIDDVINEYPTAKTWLLSYGTNDTNQDASPGAFMVSLWEIIRRIQRAIPGSSIYLSKMFFFNETDEDIWRIPYYNDAMGELTRSIPKVYWGADADTLFRSNNALFPGHVMGNPWSWLATTRTHHPNGVGMQKLAMLWKYALADSGILVTGGYYSSLGSLTADGVQIDDVDKIGLNPDNLFIVQQLMPQSVPRYLLVPGSGWKLQMQNEFDFGGGVVSVTARVENIADIPVSQVSFLLDSTPLPTTSWQDSQGVYNFQAQVNKLGQLVLAYPKPPVPATTKCNISPSTPNGNNGWYITIPKVHLSATGEWPAKSIYYKWDSTIVRLYVKEIIPIRGNHTIYYWSINQGLKEQQKSTVLRIDTTPPSKPVLPDTMLSILNGDPVALSWACRDDESGIDRYWYAVGTYPGGNNVLNWTTVTDSMGSFTPNGLPGTTYFMSAKAKNKAGLYSMIGRSGPMVIVKN